MRDFKSGSRGGFRDRGGRSGGSRFGGGGRGRDSFRPRRNPVEMTDAICSKCGKECQLPFRPQSDKPVFCSECFEKQGGNSRGGSSFGGGRDRSSQSSGGISQDQVKEINKKLDKILQVLSELEIADEGEEDEEESEEE